MAKIIMHIDLNAFYATAETIKDPSLEGKPLIIAGSSRRGIVSTASYEARKYGIRSAMPTYMARKLCPEVIIRGVDFELYQKLSSEFFGYIKRYTNIIEIASIDECYADMTECMKDVEDPEKFLKDLQDLLYKETKLKCSIGLAPTKFLAKMGSDYKKPMGITIIRRKDVSKIIWPLPIKDMYGIGKKTYPRLEKLGIYKIGDLATTESNEVKKVLGKSYEVFKMWANGYGSDEVIMEAQDPKSIGHSSTFLFDTDDYDEIKDKLFQLTQEVSARAKNEEKIGTTVTIVIKDTDFKSFTRSKTITEATNEVDDIFKVAIEQYDNNFAGRPIRLIGVTLSNLIDKSNFYVQMNLFNMEEHREKCATKLLINELNNKMKKPMLIKASELKKEDKK
ncbi:MAG: DNA polymerase IV [Erysipelotrichaceae bacterium]|nr:DNA polymerase IV [Erysipelotrichaceae bacterium]